MTSIKAIAAALNRHHYRGSADWQPKTGGPHVGEYVESRTAVGLTTLPYYEALAVAEKLERDEPGCC